MLTEQLGIEQTLIETHQICTSPEQYYCLETETTTIVNINLITLLMAISPFIIIFLTIKAFRRR